MWLWWSYIWLWPPPPKISLKYISYQQNRHHEPFCKPIKRSKSTVRFYSAPSHPYGPFELRSWELRASPFHGRVYSEVRGKHLLRGSVHITLLSVITGQLSNHSLLFQVFEFEIWKLNLFDIQTELNRPLENKDFREQTVYYVTLVSANFLLHADSVTFFIFMQDSAQAHRACETTFLPVTLPNGHRF